MKNPRSVPGALVPWAARQVLLRIAPLFEALFSCFFVRFILADCVFDLGYGEVGDQDVGDDSVRDVSLNLRESVADRMWRIKGVNPYNKAMKQPHRFGLASSFEGFTSSFGELNPKSLTMNPSSGLKIEVATWSNATPASVSNDSTTTLAGGANMEAKSRVQPTSANEKQVVGDRSKTHVDLVSSSLNVSCVPSMANVVALFGVPLNTLGDFDNLTKYIKLGNSDPLESRVKSSTNIDDTTHVDEPLIVKSVIVQDMLNSYVGATEGSKLVPSKSKNNDELQRFFLLSIQNFKKFGGCSREWAMDDS
ncbi:hypothetical protein Tco_0926492 [Tanacetum coccineum]|uniref:Uncharacterized protein n=1 Tax=Tanacetum coccineum TaxID=301880 RepID=A0ABQ5DCQ4_9ASTR